MTPQTVSFFLSAAEAAVIIPAFLICLFSAEKWLILPAKKLMLIFLPLLSAVCFLVALSGSGTRYPSRYVLYIAIPLGFLCVLLFTHLSFSKLVYIYLCMLTLLSFAVVASKMMESFLNPNLPKVYLPRAGLVVQWCFSLIALVYFALTRKKLLWLLEKLNFPSVWRVIWTIPFVILISNLFMSNMNPTILLRYQLFRVYLAVTGAFSLLFLAFQLLFYQVARTTSEKYEAEKLNQMFDAQNRQYESLNDHIEQTNRLQHDLKHIVRTIQGLARNEEYEKLLQFTDEYEQKSRTIFDPPLFFCSHVALNALLGHYAERAKERSVAIDWKIDVPSELSISDVDLNMIFGNLLDNAIKASEHLPDDRRAISLVADRNTSGCLYIVMVNNYNPEDSGERRGIGLHSIMATAEKYDGFARFFGKDTKFYSHVMVKIK